MQNETMRKFTFSKSVFAAFLFSLSFGYITAFSPFYAKIFAGREPIGFSIENRIESIKCGSDQICEDQVSLMWTSASNINALQSSALVLGRLWNTATVTCGSKVLAQYGEPHSVSLSRETFNQFHVLSEADLVECKENQIKISAYFLKGQRKGGFIDGLPYFTSAKEAQIVKNFSKFVQEDLKIFNLCGALTVLIFSIFIRIVTVDSTSGVRIKMSALSLLLACAQSGLLEVWLPIQGIAITTRWFSSITLCTWLCYVVIYLGNLQRLQTLVILGSAILSVSIYGITTSQVDTLIFFSSATCLTTLLLFLTLKFEGYLFFSVLMTLSALEFCGFRVIRSGYTAPTFIAVLIALENYRAFLSFLKVNRILKLTTLRKFQQRESEHKTTKAHGFLNYIQHLFRAQVQSSSRQNSLETPSQHTYATRNKSAALHAIIKLFQRQFKISRVTVLNLTDPQQIQIYQYTSRSALPKQITTSKLPAIFAHVVSTGNALINVHEDSALVGSLRRGEPYNGFRSEYFTVLPVFAGRETIGAIALTEYDIDQFRTSLNYSTFVFCLDIVRSLLVEHLLNTPKTESLRKLAILTESLSKGLPSTVSTPADLIDYAADVMHECFGWRVMPGTLQDNDNLLQVRKIVNFDDQVHDQVMNGKIYAHKENRQGPLALAVHERKPMIVPNVKWLEGVVHPNTMKFFGIHGTRTAAFVPVLDSSNHSNAKVIGVFWIEGVRQNEITYSDRELFLSLIKYLGDTFERLKSQRELNHSLKKLSNFVPPHLLDSYLAGETVKERDFGYLMMIDLKGSTRLAHVIGNDNFQENITLLREELRLEMSRLGLVLQQYKWDAFYFTNSIDKHSGLSVDIEAWVRHIEPVFAKWKSTLLSKFENGDSIQSLSYRVCFSYGDTTRGIVDDGATKTWTFVGNAIAVVSKVEQVSKSLPGQIFADESVVRFSLHDWEKLTTTGQGLTIYGLQQRNTVKVVKDAA